MDTSIKVNDLLKSDDMDPRLLASIKGADTDGDGQLTVKEILNVFANEMSAKAKASRRKKLLIAVSIFSLVMLAANAGLTAAVVILSKDTGVDNNIMVTKGTSTPVATAMAVTGFALDGGVEAVLQRHEELKKAERVTVDTDSGNHSFRVCGSSVNQERKTVLVYTCSDVVLAMTPDSPDFLLLRQEDVIGAGLALNSTMLGTPSLAAAPGPADANLEPSGRRLLQLNPAGKPCAECANWRVGLGAECTGLGFGCTVCIGPRGVTCKAARTSSSTTASTDSSSQFLRESGIVATPPSTGTTVFGPGTGLKGKPGQVTFPAQPQLALANT